MPIVNEIPKSRITLKYPTEINGKPVKKELPFRVLVLGDFSLGRSKDRDIELDKREPRSLDNKNFAATIKDMSINLDLQVDNKIDPQNHPELNVDIPIENMKSFNPASIAEAVPKIRSLNLLKKLLLELQAVSDNNKSFRRKLNEILKNTEQVSELNDKLSYRNNYKLTMVSNESSEQEVVNQEDVDQEDNVNEPQQTKEEV